MYYLVYSFVYLALFVLSFSQNDEKSYLRRSSEVEVCMTPSCVIAAADILTSLDETADPCNDFYSFSCGGWMKRHEVSDDQPEITIFKSIENDALVKIRDLLEYEYKCSEPPFVKMIKDFYNKCNNIDTVEKEGSEPLKKTLRSLGGWPVVEGSQWDESTFDWIDTLISFRKLGYDYDILLRLYAAKDLRNENGMYIIYLKDPGMKRLTDANLTLGLDDPKIAAYYKMMVKAAKLLEAQESSAEKELLDALHFEMTLIKIKSDADENISEKTQNETVYTIAELQKELPQVPWLKFFNGILLNVEVYENETIINENPEFLVKLVNLITSTEKRVIANYMMWRAVFESKNYLSEEWRDIEIEKEEPSKSVKIPRWKECVHLINMYSFFRFPMSSYYVRHYFSDESKDEVTVMTKYILKEFSKMLEDNDWLVERTREKAQEKAKAMKAEIGYPNELLNDTFILKLYENLRITNDSYLENILTVRKWNTDKQLSLLRMSFEEIAEMEKIFDVMEISAVYSNDENKLTIPAAILHDAFYSKDKPNYMNFGAVGYVIGHEINHGFDSKGRHYDKDGKRVNWWDKESDEQFRKKVKCIIDQYDNYTTDIGTKVNGEKTQNDNICDNGGLKAAYMAYRSWTDEHGMEPLLPGVNYTQNQIFWLSAAHVWCSKYQSERLKEFLVIDVHSPGKFRVIGPMSNLVEFSTDFKCPPDAPMNRKHKCDVW